MNFCSFLLQQFFFGYTERKDLKKIKKKLVEICFRHNQKKEFLKLEFLIKKEEKVKNVIINQSTKTKKSR